MADQDSVGGLWVFHSPVALLVGAQLLVAVRALAVTSTSGAEPAERLLARCAARRTSAKSAGKSDGKAIRESAQVHGVDVTPRGRTPVELREQYVAANSQPPRHR
ncbi:Lsr2 family DNA-binding protein [Nocardioides marmoraquaticus]